MCSILENLITVAFVLGGTYEEVWVQGSGFGLIFKCKPIDRKLDTGVVKHKRIWIKGYVD